jgi:hypothetical protein
MDHASARRRLAVALAFAWLLSAHAAEPRLFFTPTERAALDAARERNLKPRGPVKADAGEGRRDLRFSGYVSRSDGRTTLWLNGEAVDASDARRRFGVAPDPAHRRLNTAGGPLKPGQTLPADSARPREVWSGAPTGTREVPGRAEAE